jgi:two-component system nitrogen regulation response regulator NtrX
MTTTNEELDTVLVVDDEQTVRTTFREWLDGSGLGVRVFVAADAEEALKLANDHPIDLAVLDWNLGGGNDGLHLLQDLAFFHPDIVAILVTGYAQQATPLDAMRMGVRDYLDKNQDLNRESFLTIVRNQMARIRPAKLQRRLHRNLASFREAVAKVLPLVQQSALLNDPVPVPTAVRGLFRFVLETTGAADGILLVRSHDAHKDPPETSRVYDRDGALLDVRTVPFANSLAGAVSGLQAARVWQRSANRAADGFQLQPFEENRHSILAAPMAVAPGVQVVLELFDKTGGFSPADVRVAAVGVDLGVDLLRQALAERVSQRTLFDAVEAALGASEAIAGSLTETGSVPTEQTPGDAALTSLREGLRSVAAGDSADTLKLLQTVRDLALAHGPEALRHCLRIVESTAALLAPGGEAEAKS